jgi:hypothetical protein
MLFYTTRFLSPQQAFFFFRQVYDAYSTFEFYADTELPVLAKENSLIFKARWSFKNRKSNNQYVLQVFFYLLKDKDWKITEIKAEKQIKSKTSPLALSESQSRDRPLISFSFRNILNPAAKNARMKIKKDPRPTL